jgi:hypothetical protein
MKGILGQISIEDAKSIFNKGKVTARIKGAKIIAMECLLSESKTKQLSEKLKNSKYYIDEDGVIKFNLKLFAELSAQGVEFKMVPKFLH